MAQLTPSWRKYWNGICRVEVQTNYELVRRWTWVISKCELEILLIDGDLFRLFLTLKQVYVEFSIPHLFHLEPSAERRRRQGKQMTELIIRMSFGNLLGSITAGFPTGFPSDSGIFCHYQDRNKQTNKNYLNRYCQDRGVGDGQGSLVCCSPQICNESDTTEKLN